MKQYLLSFLMGIVILPGAAGAQGSASDLQVTLTLNATKYILNSASDPIQAQITITNTSGQPIIVPKGFSDRPFHLMLTFIDPDGKPIVANVSGPAPEAPLPSVIPVGNELLQVEAVETLAADFVLSVPIADVRDFYTLSKAGYYSVSAKISVRSYPAINFPNINGIDYSLLDSFNFAGFKESNVVSFALIADQDGDSYAYPEPDSRISSQTVADCNDTNAAISPAATEIPGNGIDDDCNPDTPDVIPVQEGSLAVTAERRSVGGGMPALQPIAGMRVKVFDAASGSCVTQFGMAPQNFKSIWYSCVSARDALTNVAGQTSFDLAGGPYVVMGEYNPDATPQSGDEIYVARSAELSSGESIHRQLQVIVK